MKIANSLLLLSLVTLSLNMTGCTRSYDEVWEDSRTAGRHMGRGFRSLGGKHGDSRQIPPGYDFSSNDDLFYQDSVIVGQDDFIPLQDERGHDMVSMDNMRQPRDTPGDPGSALPGIEAFQDPSHDPQLRGIFQNVLFEYNSSLIKGQKNLDIISSVADYMKHHSYTYIFVEGHCDERGPEAYNLALGSHRANAVRNMLIKEGVSPDNIFTISYGKERPLTAASDENGWSLNRRAQFKIYQR